MNQKREVVREVSQANHPSCIPSVYAGFRAKREVGRFSDLKGSNSTPFWQKKYFLVLLLSEQLYYAGHLVGDADLLGAFGKAFQIKWPA